MFCLQSHLVSTVYINLIRHKFENNNNRQIEWFQHPRQTGSLQNNYERIFSRLLHSVAFEFKTIYSKYSRVSIQFFLLSTQAIFVPCALVSLQLNVMISTVRIHSHRKLKHLWKHVPTTRGATAPTNFANFMSVFSCLSTPLQAHSCGTR